MFVKFYYGLVSNVDKPNTLYVRAVRGGACEKEDVFSFASLIRRMEECRKRKRNKANVLRFEMNLEENICLLEEELKDETYQPARSVCFAAKKPKLREIFAADFRDRIAHHVVVNYLEKIFEPKFIYDSYACREGKGNHLAVKRLRSFELKATKNNTVPAYYLQMDIRSFFINIDKNILFDLIKKRTSREDILALTRVILFNDCAVNPVVKGERRLLEKIPPHKTLFNAPKGKGLPIGNLTSQFFANVYLDELDRFVKHQLRVRYYMRYADDFILISTHKERLLSWRGKIEKFLKEKLLLELNTSCEKLENVSRGIDFLGYITRPRYVLVRRRVVGAFREKLNKIEKEVVDYTGGMEVIKFIPEKVKRTADIAASYFSHFKHADAYNLKKSILERYHFIEEFIKYRNLTRPHYFTSRYCQYEFFKNALNGIVFGFDENGQGYFKRERSIMFFKEGEYYVFYGGAAKKARKLLGLRIIWNSGRRTAGFPLGSERKFARIACSAGYSVYVIDQRKDINFTYGLLLRTLAGKYLPESPQ